MREEFLGIFIGFILRLISSTYRYHLHFNSEQHRQSVLKAIFDQSLSDQSPVIAFFHQKEMCCLPYFSRKNIHVLVSLSKDGRTMAIALKNLGYKIIDGSSHRRAIAGFIECLKAIRKGHKVTMAVDGPRGPIYKVKDGVCALSSKSGHPILPVGAIPNNAFVLKRSWNKLQLAYPFSRIDLYFGELKQYSNEELEIVLKKINQVF